MRSRCWQQQVTGLLGDPGAVRVGGHTGQINPPAAQLDEEQHVQPPQPHRVDDEEVTGHDPSGLLAEERPPCGGHPPRRWIQPMSTQHRADGGGGDPDAELLEPASDALVAPTRVLPGHTHDQLLDVLVQRWSSGLVRVGPGTGDEASVPAQQRLRPDEDNTSSVIGARRG
jgi:hypothetical protein